MNQSSIVAIATSKQTLKDQTDEFYARKMMMFNSRKIEDEDTG
jgi:hypothetical protein